MQSGRRGLVLGEHQHRRDQRDGVGGRRIGAEHDLDACLGDELGADRPAGGGQRDQAVRLRRSRARGRPVGPAGGRSVAAEDLGEETGPGEQWAEVLRDVVRGRPVLARVEQLG